MKIKSLQISNVLSFQYHEKIENAARLTFDEGLNIIIGENGSGKSTALEVINFLFKRVFYKQYGLNQDFYSRRAAILPNERRLILHAANHGNFRGFRLNPNWNTENKPQFIRIEIALDEIDKKIWNISNLMLRGCIKQLEFTQADLLSAISPIKIAI